MKTLKNTTMDKWISFLAELVLLNFWKEDIRGSNVLVSAEYTDVNDSSRVGGENGNVHCAHDPGELYFM